MNSQTKAKRNLQDGRAALATANARIEELEKVTQRHLDMTAAVATQHTRAVTAEQQLAEAQRALSLEQQCASHNETLRTNEIKSLKINYQALEFRHETSAALRRKLQELKDENDKLHAEGLPALRAANAKIKALEAHNAYLLNKLEAAAHPTTPDPTP